MMMKKRKMEWTETRMKKLELKRLFCVFGQNRRRAVYLLEVSLLWPWQTCAAEEAERELINERRTL